MILFLFGSVMFLLGAFAGMVLFALVKQIPTPAEDHFDWQQGELRIVDSND